LHVYTQMSKVMPIDGKVILGFSIFFLVLFLIDLYVFKGVKTIFSTSSFPVKRIASWAYWSINAAFIICTLCAVFSFSYFNNHTTFIFAFVAAAFILLYIPKLIFGVFLLTEDIYRLVRAIGVGTYKLVASSPAPVEFFQSRRKFVSQFATIVAGIPFLSIIYGVTKGKYNFKIHKVEVAFKDLPKEFDGFKITQLSDIHSGSFTDPEPVKHAVKLANAQGSDIMFFTGDLVNSIADEMDPWVDVFKELKAPMGVYSIFGNHDYGDYVRWYSVEQKKANLDKLINVHKQMDFRLMRNENLKLERNGATIELIGLENWGRGGFSKYGDLKKAMEGTDPNSFKILLSHDPSHWEEQVMNNDKDHIHLTLAGHTHGMQFGIEVPGIKFSPIQFKYKRWGGLYEENNRYLYVNRGLGFIGFPGRVGIWPEITVVTLRCA
jgi:predicted MPP superfamily phosphohydrolase